VLENLARQVPAYDAAGDRADLLLDGWEAHPGGLRRRRCQGSATGAPGRPGRTRRRARRPCRL
jgi:purine catabolism regulator